MHSRVASVCVLFALVAISATGCGRDIGDSCASNVECDPLGTRFCDVSTPSGYCTIDGCDVGTCPEEAVCVRFFTLIPNRGCSYDAQNPTGRGLADSSGTFACRADERCLCDGRDNTTGECLGSAYCSPESSERRWCQKKCDGNGDCRQGYVCRSTGTLGAEPVPRVDDAGASFVPAKFCAPTLL